MVLEGNKQTARLFIGLPLLGEEGRQLEIWARDRMVGIGSKSKLRWIPRRNYHMTITFLGQVMVSSAMDCMAEIEEAWQASCRQHVWRAPFSLAASDRLIAGLPKQTRAKVVALNLQAEPWLEEVVHLIRTRCWDHNLGKPENRGFIPHVSLLRSSMPLNVQEQLEEKSEEAAEGDTFKLPPILNFKEVALFQSQSSQQQGEPPIYVQLRSFKLIIDGEE